jgi:transcriptional regulator with XRE-family HTH domain
VTRLEEFIEALRLERRRQRVKQVVLAATLGVKQQALCNWEKGYATPTDEHLHAWSAGLGLQVPAGVVGAVPRIAKCGTPQGHHRHARSGEPACDPCRLAINAYQRARRTSRLTAVAPP